MKKRIIAMLMCLILVLGILPVSTLAAKKIDSGKCGDNAKWTLDSNYVLTISGKGDMYDFDLTLTEWDVRSIIIKDGITSIGSHAFVGRSGLTSVTIPDSVTKIGDHAFYACESLTEIDIPDSVTYIGESAFLNCYSLVDYEIPDSITYIGESAFNGVPVSKNFNTYSDAKSIIDIGVCGDDLIWILDDTHAMTIIGEGDMYDFDLTLTEWDVKSVVMEHGITSIGSHAFVGRSGLISVTIPDSVTKIGDYAFYACESLAAIDIPDSVTYIGESAFLNCYSLTDYAIPKGVTYIGESAFSGVPVSKNYNTYSNAENIVDIGVCGDNLIWTLDDTFTLTITGKGDMYDFDLTLTEWDVKSVSIEEGVTSIGSHAFAGRSNIDSVTIPESVTKIGDLAFYYCQSLSGIVIPASVTYIGSDVFVDCSKLEIICFKGDAPEFAGDELFSRSGLTICYPEGNSTWNELKESWSDSINWEEYDPANISDIMVEKEASDNIVEEVVPEDDSETTSEGNVAKILISVCAGVFVVILLLGVCILLYVLITKIKDKKANKTNDEQKQ